MVVVVVVMVLVMVVVGGRGGFDGHGEHSSRENVGKLLKILL